MQQPGTLTVFEHGGTYITLGDSDEDTLYVTLALNVLDRSFSPSILRAVRLPSASRSEWQVVLP